MGDSKTANDPIIPSTNGVSPEEALRAFMQVEGRKVKEKEEEQRGERRAESPDDR